MKKILIMMVCALTAFISCDESKVEPEVKIEVESVKLSVTSDVSLIEGETQQITATVLPNNADDKTLTWKSSNSAVATVENGLITAVAEGNATITALAENGKSATVKVFVTAEHVAVESINITPEENFTLEIDQIKELTATILPENATDKSVKWESSNNGVATVDANGKVTAIETGTVTIYATAIDSDEDLLITDKVEVTVVSKTIKSITITPSDDFSLDAADSKQLTATIDPVDAATVIWSSDDENIANVNQTGLVVGRNAGSTIIRAKAGDKEATVKVTVTSPSATAIAFDPAEDVKLALGNTVTLNIEPTPSTASIEGLEWSSDNPSIVSVDNGVIKGESVGSATIEAKLGTLKASIKVIVSDGWNLSNINEENYPEGDTWVIEDDIIEASPNQDLAKALYDVFQKRGGNVTITLVFPNLESASSYRIIEQINYDFPKLAISAPKYKHLRLSDFKSRAIVSINMPMIEKIDFNPFYAMYSLESLVLNPLYFTVEDGVVYNKDKSKLIAYLHSNKTTTYIASSSVKVVGTDAFAYNEILTAIEIPEAHTIENTAFIECENLTSIKLPKVSIIDGNFVFNHSPIANLELASKVRYTGHFDWAEDLDLSKITLTTNDVNADGFKMTSSGGTKSKEFFLIIKDDAAIE